MPYYVEFTRPARKELDALPNPIALQLKRHILALEETPRPRGAKKLKGFKSAYRIRSGDYRIVYSVEDKTKTVTVTHVAHRREVYR